MKTSADAGKLAPALATLAGLATDAMIKKIPALGAVKLTTGDGAIVASFYARDVQLALTIPVTVIEPGELAVAVDTLARLVGGFPKSSTIEIANGDSTAIICSDRSRFRLPIFPTIDLPTLTLTDEIACITITRNDLIELLRPAFAVSDQVARYYLCGLHLHTIDGNLAAVATDTHRLARSTISGAADFAQGDGCIVPTAGLKVIGRLLASHRNVTEVALRRSATLFEIKGGPFRLTVKLIDGTYPDYRRAIGSPAGTNTVTVEREAMIAALTRVDAVVGAAAVAGLTWGGDGQDGGLHICAAKHSDIAADTVAVTGMSGSGRVAISTAYGLDVLEALGGEVVTIDAGLEPGVPLWITNGAAEFVTVLLPVYWG